MYIDSDGTVSGMMDKPANMGGIGYLALGRILARRPVNGILCVSIMSIRSIYKHRQGIRKIRRQIGKSP